MNLVRCVHWSWETGRAIWFKVYLRTAPEGLATAMCWVTEPEAGMVEEEGGSSCSCIDFGTAACEKRFIFVEIETKKNDLYWSKNILKTK